MDNRVKELRGAAFENGRYNPSLELAWKLSRALGVTIENLFRFPKGD